MRIKRQRRKLRGKYSGNCLSCSAKWSKCWYIASTENQAEWESRLCKSVTPCDDEVCFQCWDAKIRTSPKRKMHFKAELPLIGIIPDDPNSSYPLRPSKRVGRNKRRALNDEYASYSPQDDYADQNSDDGKQVSDDSDDDDEEEYFIEDNSSSVASRIYKESVVLDEENAVLLLSTAFHSIPQHISDVDIDIGGYHMDGIAFDDISSKRRGAYACGRCGKLKKGHICDIPSPSDEIDQTPSPSSPIDNSPSIVLIPKHPVASSTIPIQSVFQPQSVGIISALLAQPVNS